VGLIFVRLVRDRAGLSIAVVNIVSGNSCRNINRGIRSGLVIVVVVVVVVLRLGALILYIGVKNWKNSLVEWNVSQPEEGADEKVPKVLNHLNEDTL